MRKYYKALPAAFQLRIWKWCGFCVLAESARGRVYTAIERLVCTRACLYQAAHAQVLLDDDVVHGSHDESDLHGVGGACDVDVNLLRGMLVEASHGVLAIFLASRTDAISLTRRIG